MSTQIKTDFCGHDLGLLEYDGEKWRASMEFAIRSDGQESDWYVKALAAHLPDNAEVSDSFTDRGWIYLRYDLELSIEPGTGEFEFAPDKDDFEKLDTHNKTHVLNALQQIEPLVAEMEKSAKAALETIKNALGQ